MIHLDEVALVVFRDGESDDPELEEHVRDCASCSTRLTDARQRATAIEALLSGPTTPTADRSLAKARVRRRLDTERARAPRYFTLSLRRAAAILALSAGAAYALPWSPVPAWLGRGASEVETDPVEAEPKGGESGAQAGAVPQEAVLVPVGPRLDVFVEEVQAGREVEVLWLAGTNAWVTAGPGARYSVGDGSATVRAPNGPVRLGIPRSAPWVSLRINGRMVYEGAGDDDGVERMVFRAPAR